MPVPLGYGRLLTGSIVASATMRHVDRNTVDITYGHRPGGLSHLRIFDNYLNLAEYQNREKVVDSFGADDPEGAFDLARDVSAGEG